MTIVDFGNNWVPYGAAAIFALALLTLFLVLALRR